MMAQKLKEKMQTLQAEALLKLEDVKQKANIDKLKEQASSSISQIKDKLEALKDKKGLEAGESSDESSDSTRLVGGAASSSASSPHNHAIADVKHKMLAGVKSSSAHPPDLLSWSPGGRGVPEEGNSEVREREGQFCRMAL